MMQLIWDGDSFTKELKQKRLIEDDIDMRSLSERISVSAATISRCENGKMPDLDAYAKICSYLGKSMDTFIKCKTKNKKT